MHSPSYPMHQVHSDRHRCYHPDFSFKERGCFACTPVRTTAQHSIASVSLLSALQCKLARHPKSRNNCSNLQNCHLRRQVNWEAAGENGLLPFKGHPVSKV